jgi:hypothetical protein
MPLQLRVRQSQIRQAPWNARAGMVRDDDEIRSTLDLDFLERRRLVGGKQRLMRVRHEGRKRPSLPLTDQALHGLSQFSRIEANTVLEHDLNIFDVLDVLRRIARDDYQVGRLAGADRADLIALA